MAKSYEDVLRRMMFVVGKSVERVIGGAQRARAKVEIGRGIRPLLSLESQLDPALLRTLIGICEERILKATVPNLTGKKSLELCEGPAIFLSSLMQLGSSRAFGLEAGDDFQGRVQGDLSRGFLVKGAFSLLPFPSEAFDYVVARLTTPLQGDVATVLREIARVLSTGGQGVILDYHPFGLYASRGAKHLRAVQARIHSLQDYYKMTKAAGVRIVDLREGFLDDETRKFFTEAQIQTYRNLKGTPLVVCLYVYKPRKK